MTELMWKILYTLLLARSQNGDLSLQQLQKTTGADLTGLAGDPAIARLVEMGLIEETDDHRYKLVVTE